MSLPLLSGGEVVNALLRRGYYVRRQKGSHIRLYHAARGPVTVPDHKEIDRGTLRSILRQAGLSPDEFADLL
ncbi:MAG: type II toxin-antitoxin system HicA family toxin [Elusimicrobia bacterium]|nr:type II toxin-antitoxin system HicA family toxin [Elusimicrobiota bacterium]